LLIRHSKYSDVVKNTLPRTAFSAILPTGLMLDYVMGVAHNEL